MDPGGVYIRKYLPQLSRMPAEFIYEPWKAPESVQREAGCVIGVDYPVPIVNHEVVREAFISYSPQETSPNGGGGLLSR